MENLETERSMITTNRLFSLALLLLFASSALGQNGGYSIFKGTMVDMSWPEIKAAGEAGALVLLPMAVIEEHGPHMSLGSDAYLTYHYCMKLKEELETRQINAIVAPPIYWGIMQETETGAYPGSFTVQPATMKALIHDVLADLKRWGFTRVYPMNLHGDRLHQRTASEAMAEAKESLGLKIFGPEDRDPKNRPTVSRFKSPDAFSPDYHAGASETGEMVANFPREVNVEKAKTLKPQSGFHPLGYVGDPANYQNANIAATEAYVKAEADEIARWLKAPAK